MLLNDKLVCATCPSSSSYVTTKHLYKSRLCILYVHYLFYCHLFISLRNTLSLAKNLLMIKYLIFDTHTKVLNTHDIRMKCNSSADFL